MSTGNPPQLTDQQKRLQVAREIVQMFSAERITYLSLSGVTAVIVIVESTIVIHANSGMFSSGVALFGAGGVVAFNIGRLLTMFNKVIEHVFVNDSNSNHGADDADRYS